MITYRPYQLDIKVAQDDFLAGLIQPKPVKRGQVWSPVGSGKTLMFTDVLRQVSSTPSLLGSQNQFLKILLVHPRLALSIEQQERLKSDVGDDYEFTSFHSGRVAQTGRRGTRINKSTIDVTKLEEILSTSSRHNLVYTSYHSLSKIASIDWDLIICDEAHNLLEKRFFKILDRISSPMLFYTATPGYTSTDKISMLNTEVFGQPIVEVKPGTLIEPGYITGPRIMVAEIHTTNEDDERFVEPAAVIANTYSCQEGLFREDSSDKINHKMLVAMSNTKMFADVMAKLPSIRQQTGFDLDLYYVSASEHVKNGVPTASREALLSEFSTNANHAIILHCDTLAEGIDVDGLTGAFLFRRLSKTKFIQTMGRTARPSKRDLIDGEPVPMMQRLKKFSVVTLPIINGTELIEDAIKYAEAFTDGGYGDILDYWVHGTGKSASTEEGDPKDIFYAQLKDYHADEAHLDGMKDIFDELFWSDDEAA